MEIMISLQWFNPYIYRMKKELWKVHEYIADNEVVEDETNKSNYMNYYYSSAQLIILTNKCFIPLGIFSQGLKLNGIFHSSVLHKFRKLFRLFFQLYHLFFSEMKYTFRPCF